MGGHLQDIKNNINSEILELKLLMGPTEVQIRSAGLTFRSPPLARIILELRIFKLACPWVRQTYCITQFSKIVKTAHPCAMLTRDRLLN